MTWKNLTPNSRTCHRPISSFEKITEDVGANKMVSQTLSNKKPRINAYLIMTLYHFI